MWTMRIVDLDLEGLELKYVKLRSRRPGPELKLLSSLGEAGQQSPVVVVPAATAGRYVVIDGHKRVRALKKLKADVVKAVVWDMPCEQALVAAYQMGHGSCWNALEEGWLVAELVRGEGWSLSAAGRSLNRSEGWASRRLGLVESLPEAVLAGVQEGRIGAYAATKYLLPLARAKAQDCEALAEKIGAAKMSSRQVGLLYRHYIAGSREAAQRIVEDPARFLKALEAAGQKDAVAIGSMEDRCLKNLELVGGVALGLARSLPQAVGYDLPDGSRERLRTAWRRVQERLGLLEKTAAAVFAIRAGPETVVNAKEACVHAQ